MGAGCIHCREKRLEQTRQGRQRARLTDEERRALGLVVQPLVPRFVPRPRVRNPPRPVFGLQSVLPAHFRLPPAAPKASFSA